MPSLSRLGGVVKSAGLSMPLPFRVLFLLSLMLPIAASANGEPDGGDAALPPLAVQGCFGCHGPAGRSGAPAIPSLAGLPRDYLLAVLRAYRHGGRFGTVMERLLAGSSEAQLEAMADYFSRQPAQIPKQRIMDWDRVSRGRQLHRHYCRECHGDTGRKPEDGVPRLNGQWMAYLRWTLQDYLIGINQAGDGMSRALIRLIRRHGDDGLEALIHYYASARPKAP